MNRFEQLSEAEQIDGYTRLARKALEAYGLGDAEMEWLPGSEDAVFRVTKVDEHGGRTYALRISNPERPVDQLPREIAWLTALCRDTDLIVPEPVLARDGELIRRVGIAGVPGFRGCTLLRWVRGRPIDADPDPDLLRQAGALAAKLHQHGAGYRWPDELATPRRVAVHAAEGISRAALSRHADQAAADVFFTAAERLQAVLAQLGEGAEAAGIVHGNFGLRKIRFHAKNVGVVGFDRCSWGYHLADIAMLFVGLRGRAEAEALRAAFLGGYRAVRPIADEILAQLPAFDALRAIDEIAQILSRDHELLVAEPRELLERPLSVLAEFADA